jgi:hypothetical protein
MRVIVRVSTNVTTKGQKAQHQGQLARRDHVAVPP